MTFDCLLIEIQLMTSLIASLIGAAIHTVHQRLQIRAIDDLLDCLPHQVLPYNLCTNDSKFAPGRAFSTADDFYNFVRAAVDALIEEADTTGVPRMLSVGLHPRLIGHPARIG